MSGLWAAGGVFSSHLSVLELPYVTLVGLSFIIYRIVAQSESKALASSLFDVSLSLIDW